ncbi:hypothetical protein [Staphylococcus phage vB_StaM_SA1]|nr:hypothetical protein [Staphylococcus phage vB_StaM_SA1]
MKYFKVVVSGDKDYISADNREIAFEKLSHKELLRTHSFTMDNKRNLFIISFYSQADNCVIIGSGLWKERYFLDILKREMENYDLGNPIEHDEENNKIVINEVKNVDNAFECIKILINSVKSQFNNSYKEFTDSLLEEISAKEFKNSIVIKNFK